MIPPSDPTISDSPLSADARNERSLQLALAAARVAEDNRGEDIVVLDLREQTPVFDYFVIATGSSRRQLHAISEDIDHRLEDDLGDKRMGIEGYSESRWIPILGDKRMGIEGYSESRWILLDYGSVVIHLLDAETREYYAIEDLWTGAQRVPLPWASEETT